MAVDFFLKLDGIDGESSDSKHKGEIQIESFSWGASNSGSAAHGAGGGGGAGKVSVQDFHFVTPISKASPQLFLSCCTGEHIKQAILTCRKAGERQTEFYVIKLTDILVSSYEQSGDSGDVVPTDQFSINYSKIELEYRPQAPDGSTAAAVKAGWDVKSNTKV